VKKKSIVIYGTGGQAKEIFYLFDLYELGKIAAFTVEKDFFTITELSGLPVVPFEDVSSLYPPDKHNIFIAVGPQYVNRVRERIYLEAKSKGYSFVNNINQEDNTLYPNIVFGDNVFVLGSEISPYVEIGNNVSMMAAKIGHHTRIGNNALLSCCTVGGNVIIEENAVISLGSVIAPKVRIGAHSVVGMGCVINHNVEPRSVYSSHSSVVKRNINSLRLKLG
jgi:carbonic anhydrase/acetyltransferase-like protein (isoleucine patch superfamily)